MQHVEKAIENARAIIETLSLAADGPHQIMSDQIDRVTRAALDELKRAQKALYDMDGEPEPATAIHAVA